VTLHVVPVTDGSASLGSWGSVVLTGANSALLRLAWNEDIQVPPPVAADVTGGVLLLNEEAARLLFLPYAGELVVLYDLAQAQEASPPIFIPRDPDHGMRMAAVRIVAGRGAVYLTEMTLMLLTEQCDLAWRRDEDFAGWSIEEITPNEVHLSSGDWLGREQRQVRSLVDGTRLE
jgi:hypothetical protein